MLDTLTSKSIMFCKLYSIALQQHILFSVKQIPDILCALLSNKRMVLSLEYGMQVGGDKRSKGYFNLVPYSPSDKLLSSP